ncbi:hypothetical protein QCN27_02100 [Cereibacter sp. SYSU M97828]|nr:hypothetical protein [Cereibacter flavus]
MKRPLFLARGPYRRRRLRDAARILPFAGAVLFLMPLLWPSRGTGLNGLYMLAVWLGLVAVAAVLRLWLGDESGPED